MRRQKLCQIRPAAQRALHQGPAANGLLDRGQRPAQQDRGGNHRTGRHVAPDHQQGTQSEHRGLQEQSQRTAGGRETAAQIRHAQIPDQNRVTRPCPARKGRLAHSKGLHHLGLGLDLVAEPVHLDLRLLSLRQRLTGCQLIGQCQQNQHPAAAQGQIAQPWVEQGNSHQENRHPRHVEHCHGDRRGDQPLHRFEVAQPVRCTVAGLSRSLPQHRLEHAAIQPGLKPCPDPRHHPRAGVIKERHDGIEKRHKRRQCHQRGNRAACQHPVIDLQHVDRPGQHQQIGENAEQAHRPVKVTALAPFGPQFPKAGL